MHIHLIVQKLETIVLYRYNHDVLTLLAAICVHISWLLIIHSPAPSNEYVGISDNYEFQAGGQGRPAAQVLPRSAQVSNELY